MELILTRIAKRKGYTIGRLAIQYSAGQKQKYFCDTLEPAALEMKTTVDKRAVMRSPRKVAALKPFAIPEGHYAVVVSWSPKMRLWLPMLLGVPMFSGIRIHAGNTAKDTQGCILVGVNLKKGMVLNSRIWMGRLMQKIVEARDRDEAVWITVV